MIMASVLRIFSCGLIDFLLILISVSFVSSDQNICTTWNATGKVIEINMDTTVISGDQKSCYCQISVNAGTLLEYDFSLLTSETCRTTFALTDFPNGLICQNSSFNPSLFTKLYTEDNNLYFYTTSNNNTEEIMSGNLQMKVLGDDEDDEIKVQCLSPEIDPVQEQITPIVQSMCTNWTATGKLFEINMNTTLIAGTGSTCRCFISVNSPSRVLFDFNSLKSTTCAANLILIDDSIPLRCVNGGFTPLSYEKEYLGEAKLLMITTSNDDRDEIISGNLQIGNLETDGDILVECDAPEILQPPARKCIDGELSEDCEPPEIPQIPIVQSMCTNWTATGKLFEINMNTTLIAGTGSICRCFISVNSPTRVLFDFNSLTSTSCAADLILIDDSIPLKCENGGFIPLSYVKEYFAEAKLLMITTSNDDPEEMISGNLQIGNLQTDGEISVECEVPEILQPPVRKCLDGEISEDCEPPEIPQIPIVQSICTNWTATGKLFVINMNTTLIAGTGSSCSCLISMNAASRVLFDFNSLKSTTCAANLNLFDDSIPLSCENGIFIPPSFEKEYFGEAKIFMLSTSNSDPEEILSGNLQIENLLTDTEISIECQSPIIIEEPPIDKICTSWQAVGERIEIDMDTSVIAGNVSSCSCVISVIPGSRVLYDFNSVKSTSCGTTFRFTDNSIGLTCENSNFSPTSYETVYTQETLIFLITSSNRNPEEFMSGIFQMQTTNGQISVECLSPQSDEAPVQTYPGGDICARWTEKGKRVDINMDTSIIAGTGSSCSCFITLDAGTRFFYVFSSLKSTTCATQFFVSENPNALTCENGTFLQNSFEKYYLEDSVFSLLITSNNDPGEIMSGTIQMKAMDIGGEISVTCEAPLISQADRKGPDGQGVRCNSEGWLLFGVLVMAILL